MMQIEKLQGYPELGPEEAEKYLSRAIRQVECKLEQYTDKFPDSNSVGGVYPVTENTSWTTGFWTGQLWLSYEKSGRSSFRRAGELQVESFLERILNKREVAHHDMGFLYSPSCVAAYLLTGNEHAREAAVLAADNLLGRFQEKGQFFQAWGQLGAEENYRLIIDCLLNMPLLFWASDVTGNPGYAEKAQAHIRTAMNYVIRPDHSTYHTYFFDPETGKPKKGVTHQGYRDGSAWARGQAWGIYGSALSYGRLKEQKYVDIFEKLTDFFLTHLPENLVPYWDFDFTDPSLEPRDSSASAIAACGMLEMAKYLIPDKADYYVGMAKRLLRALGEHCAVEPGTDSNGILLHGTYAKSSPYNTCPDLGVDECTIWGDYYYLEALIRLSGEWNSYW